MECRIGLPSNRLTNKDCAIGCAVQAGFPRYLKRDWSECIMKRPSEFPAFFPHRFSLVSSQSVPVVENSCPMTFGSRSCRGYLSGSFQNLQSIRHRPLLLLYSSLLVCTLPSPRSWKYRTALPHCRVSGCLLRRRSNFSNLFLREVRRS